MKKRTKTCENCYYWAEGGEGERDTCRRHAPTRLDSALEGESLGFPEVLPFHWCGEWKLEEDATEYEE